MSNDIDDDISAVGEVMDKVGVIRGVVGATLTCTAGLVGLVEGGAGGGLSSVLSADSVISGVERDGDMANRGEAIGLVWPMLFPFRVVS